MKYRKILLLLLPVLKIHGQCIDEFNNAIWSSDWTNASLDFVINSQEQIQLEATGAGYSILTWDLNNCFQNSEEWRFYIHQSFAGSTNNYGKIIFNSSGSVDSAGYNETCGEPGYLLRFGSAGSADAIEWMKDNGTGTLELLGSGFNIANGINGWIKISKNNGYQIYFKDHDSTDYQLIIQSPDSTFEDFQFCHLQCYYTSSNSTHFSFDDFYAGPEWIPEIPYEPYYREVVINEIMADPSPSEGLPEIEYVELYNNSPYPIHLKNWKWVNSSTSKDIPECTLDSMGMLILCDLSAVLNFIVPAIGIENFGLLTNGGDSLSLISANGSLIDFVVYDLHDYGMEEKEEGGWSLEQINPALTCSDHFNWKASCNPNGGSPGLINCQFQDDFPTFPFQLMDNGIDTLGNIYLWTNIPIDQDSIDLYYNGYHHTFNLEHHSDSAWFHLGNNLHDTIKPLILNELKSCLADTLQAITIQVGKPQNAALSALFLTELMSHPKDGSVQYVEIYNPSSIAISLDNLQIRNSSDQHAHIQNHHHFVYPHSALCLSEQPEKIIPHFPSSVSYQPYHHKTDIPYFTQAEGKVTLVHSSTLLDVQEYQENLHHPLIVSPIGVSFERVNIPCPSDHPCWTSGSEHFDFGSPGYFFPPLWEYENMKLSQWEIAAAFLSPNQDGKNDFLSIRWKGGEENHLISISILDMAGTLIKTICQDELNSLPAYWIWDGTHDSGILSEAGMYFMLIEDQPLGKNKSQLIKSVVLSP